MNRWAISSQSASRTRGESLCSKPSHDPIVRSPARPTRSGSVTLGQELTTRSQDPLHPLRDRRTLDQELRTPSPEPRTLKREPRTLERESPTLKRESPTLMQERPTLKRESPTLNEERRNPTEGVLFRVQELRNHACNFRFRVREWRPPRAKTSQIYQ
jgi:hypothetical protein